MAIDLLTGEEFEPTRKNQKFVTNSNRIKYHNNRANALRKRKATYDKPLAHNLKILDSLLSSQNEMIVTHQYLLGAGFDFKATNGLDKHEGQSCYCIYNYLLVHEKETTKIIKK